MTDRAAPARPSRAALLLVGVLLVLARTTPPAPAAEVAPAGSWPLAPAQVVGGFAPPAEAWGAGHRGVDLAGRVGQPVAAALPGRVAFAATLAGRGVVVVDHGGTRTTYEPVLAAVRRGDVVAAGDPLGTLEQAGSHCLPAACLHWGWRQGEVYLDPLLLVGGGPVRLLPLDGADPEVPASAVGPVGVAGPAAQRRGTALALPAAAAAGLLVPPTGAVAAVVLRRAGAPAGRLAGAGRS